MQLFIKDNQGGEETTVVNHLGMFGSPLDATNMREFKRVCVPRLVSSFMLLAVRAVFYHTTCTCTQCYLIICLYSCSVASTFPPYKLDSLDTRGIISRGGHLYMLCAILMAVTRLGDPIYCGNVEMGVAH